jgi:hypothetical protein
VGLTQPPQSLSRKMAIAQCGLPENEIGCSTAEAAAGQIHTTRAWGWANPVRLILPGANVDLRWRGIRAVANAPGGWRQILLEATSGSYNSGRPELFKSLGES